ncbi:peptidase M15 [Occultella glacieicola]|uniref:Peptidase M15 n=1 Tax=Occultella glacieicola TaxID=2518684 RepID=A0ABY2E396_9MICO|nr:M15 family metallopeptidase [Occultella glacieicola]TDE94091.1 peptidase M15 [Occultella glacieicola]
MRRRNPPPARTHTTFWTTAVGLLVVLAAIAGLLGHRSGPTAAAPPSTSWSLEGIVGEGEAAEAPDDGTIGPEDGVLPEGTSVFDDRFAGVVNVDPALLQALRDAAADAAERDIAFELNSGWRSPEYQDQLLEEAVTEYGSRAEAARWVATADTSPHVSGDAVDVGPYAAMDWLAQHGDEYGLCQIYGNEPWHYELRPEAVDGRCPRMYADPTEDPRMAP